MWQTGLTKRPAAHAPAAGASGESEFHGAHGVAFERGAETEFRGGEAQQAFRGTSQQALSGAIDQAQFIFVVEGEDGHVDLFHHGAQQGAGFQCAEALFAQGLAEGIYFNHYFAHGVVAIGAARAHRKIFFAHGGQKIGKSLQREGDAMAHGDGKSKPQPDDEDAQSPDGARGIVARPQQNQGDGRTRQSRRDGQELDAMFVAERLHSKPYFCKRRYIALRLRPSALAAWLTLPLWRERVRWMRWCSTSSRLMSSSRGLAPAAAARKPRSAARTVGPLARRTPRSIA